MIKTSFTPFKANGTLKVRPPELINVDGKARLTDITLRPIEEFQLKVGLTDGLLNKKEISYIETENTCTYYKLPYKLTKELKKALEVLE